MSNWKSMDIAPKDANIILSDGEDVFEGYYIKSDFVRADNENLAFAIYWQELPELPKHKICTDCQDGCNKDGSECKTCKGHVFIWDPDGA